MRTSRRALVAILTLVLVATGTQAAQAQSKYTVTLNASTTEVSFGKPVVLSGKVSPKAAGKTVTIERRYGNGPWKKLTTTKLSSKSKFSKTIKPSKGGPTSYRVKKPSSASNSAGKSPVKSISVYRWRDLTDLPLLDENTDAIYVGNWNINGNTFPGSFSTTLVGPAPAWNISVPQCTKIRTYVGIDEDSPAGTTGSSQLLLDFPEGPSATVSTDNGLSREANPRYVQKTFAPGHTKLSLAGGLVTPAGGTPYLVLGSPQVFCNS